MSLDENKLPVVNINGQDMCVYYGEKLITPKEGCKKCKKWKVKDEN